MRSKVVKTLALALLLCGIDMIAAQQPGSPPGGSKPRPGGATGLPGRPQKQKVPEKSKLEEMLAEALQNNPDIRVAAAKLAEADAELNRTRLQVTQKVVMLYHAIEMQKKVLEHAEKRNRRAQQIRAGAISQNDIDEIMQALALAKGKLEELEAQLPALLGKSARAETVTAALAALAVRRVEVLSPVQMRDLHVELVDPSNHITFTEWAKRHKATGPMAERLRKALQTPVKVDYRKMHFPDILKDLTKKVPGLTFRNLFADGERMGIPPNAQDMSLHFEEMLPVSAILQALADESGCCLYVREYGILVTVKENAPPGGMTIEEFLRQKPAEK